MIHDNCVANTLHRERKFSARLAKKKNDTHLFTAAENFDKNNSSAEILIESEDKEKLKNSQQFLECLELKPVKLELNQNIDNSSDIFNLSAVTQKKIKHKRNLSSISETKSNIKFSKARKAKKNLKNIKKKLSVIETKENETAAKQADITCDHEIEETKLIPDRNPTEQKKEESSCSNLKTLSDSSLDKETSRKVDNLDNHCVKKLKQIYIFRDLNRIVPIDEKTFKDEVGNDLLSAVDLNRHGKKRRYDKLMKKLEDGEKVIESNLKEVKLMEDDDGDKEDIDHCVEKLKEKLRVREKKKYEYLINYMRDQWKVDQQSFQDLLPQKVDQVKADVVKQLGAHIDKAVAEKRLRGRPRKITPFTSDEKKETVAAKKPRLNTSKKNVNPQRKKNSASQRGFPVKFPKSLLPDSSLAQNRNKFENFRLGIVDKDGGQKIIELNCDTVNQTTHVKDSSSSYDKSPFKEGNSSLLALDSSKLFVSPAVTVKTPPMTITLPSISSLEKDYELVSLLPSCPPCIGNIKTDHFYIPQSTFDQGGKTGMIMVGPFCMVFDPKPRLVLVSPEQSKKSPAMILRRKIHSPSKTPPRDFRIRRDSSRSFRPSERMLAEFKHGEQGDPATVAHDHDYMTPLELRDNVRRYCKAVAKHSANARFIDARVEDITKGEDNLVVTIKGDNLLRRVKNLSNFSEVPMQNNEDGMPIVYSLSQIMTETLMKAQLLSKREEMVFESSQSGDYSQVLFPLPSMGDVVMEVLIPPGGTEIEPKPKSKSTDDSNRLQDSVSNPEIVENFSDEVKFLNSNEVKYVNSSEVKFLNSNTCIDCEIPDISDALNNFRQETVALKKDDIIPVENESAADGTSLRPNLRCCKVCLRLFPSDYVLFTHVRSHHATCESRDTVYLEELRARSRLACPACCDPPAYFATPSKLRRHLRQHHGIEHYVETCKFCRSEFLDKHELDLHMDLTHNSYPRRGLVSLLTPPHQMVRSERSLLSCSRCNIVFSDRSSLLSHTLKVHPELNQFNICRLCDKVFDSGPALHKHLKKAHEQTHAGELKCPFCPAWLPDMDLASVHRLTLHSGAVPVHCPFCGAGYQSLHPMYNHVRIQHLQTEAHVCPECQASFPSSRMLSEHARKVHLISPRIMKDAMLGANGTTYCCPFCTVSFMRTYDLAVHVINSHRDHLLPAQCHMCMQSFVSDIVMKMHMSGAHGIDVDGSDDSSYYDGRDTVVLEDDSGLFGHNDGYVGRVPSRRLVPRHIIEHQDILETQEAGRYLEELEERETETIVYLNERNEVVNTGEMFGSCSTIEDVQLLCEAGEDFNLHAVDYLETLSNDSIAVGADVVADVGMEEMANGRGVMTRNQDLLGMASHFEMDGVLYELAASHDASNHHLRGSNEMMGIDEGDIIVSGDRRTMDADDFAHLLRQQVQ